MLIRLGKRLLARWKAVLLLFALVFGAAIGSAYGYARHSWRAAQTALRQDRPADARKKLRICRFFWPRNVETHLVSARAARLTGDLQEAEALLNRCLVLHQGATEAVQLEFLLLRVQTGEDEEVVPVLIDCVEKKHPETPIILETLTQMYLRRLRYQPAYACLSGWIDFDPHAAKAFHWRGWVLERMNSPQIAKDNYLRAIELDPDMPAPRLRMVEILLMENSPLEAWPHIERLQRQFPERADVTARAGQFHYLQGQYPEARRLLEKAEKELPDDLAVLLHLAKLDLQDNRAADAERRLRHMLEIDATDTEASYTLVTAIQHQGRRDDAIKALADYRRQFAIVERTNRLLREEAEAPGKSVKTAHEIGVHLLSIGRTNLGIYWLEQALQRDPSHEATHKALADHYEKSGDAQRAALHRRTPRSADAADAKEKKPAIPKPQ